MSGATRGFESTTAMHRRGRVLVLSRHLQDRIVAHLRAALPNEGVALLAEPGETAGAIVQPHRIFPGTNMLHSPVRYCMDWDELVAAMQQIERNGWRLAAIAHSHTRGPATPSVTDVAEAWYPDALMLIVSFTGESPEMRAWSLDGAVGALSPREVPIVPVFPDNDPLPGIAVSSEHRE